MQEYNNSSEEFSLVDTLAVIKRHRRTILLVPFLSVIIAALLVYFVIKPQWEASTILQVGQVGQVTKLVEPAINVVERMKHPSFRLAVMKKAGFNTPDSNKIAKLYKKSLVVIKSKDSDILTFQVRAYSPEMAKLLAEQSVVYLQSVHSDLMQSGITRIQSQIKEVDADIAKLNIDNDIYLKQLQANHNWDSYNAVLSAFVMKDKSSELRDLKDRRLILIEQLSASQTFNTKVLGGIVVDEDAVFPQKGLIISLAAFTGLLMALLYVFFKSAIKL